MLDIMQESTVYRSIQRETQKQEKRAICDRDSVRPRKLSVGSQTGDCLWVMTLK